MEQSATAPSPACDPYALLDLLERVEVLPEDACGAFLVRGTGIQEGTIYVQHARVCWAVARGMGRRLTDLLLANQPGTSRETMEGLYRTCRVEGRPLGQTLVERGLIDADGLRNALARHTAEALLRVSRGQDQHVEWVARESGSYDAMFTFDPVEILSWVGALKHHQRRSAALAELRAIVPAGCFGAAFAWPESIEDHLPICVVGSGEQALSAAIDLGKWGHNGLDLARAAIERCSPVTAIAPDGKAAVAWTSEDGFCTGLCETLPALARLLSNHGRLKQRPTSN